MSTALDICIVTCDIVGPIRNGGIGTAYANLAHALARAGHRVTVLYALGEYCEQRTIAHWQAEYRSHGIELVPMPAQPVRGHSAMRLSYGVYCWLKTRRFDVVHCHEWRGLAYYTALAKGQGLCLEGAVLCVGAHSPVLWHLEGMNEMADAETLEVDFMERESVARADVLWSPSRHMLAWMRREGWRLPRRIVQKPYILLDQAAAPRAAAAPDAELVFFGRLETRKGLDLFCDAIDRLVARGVVPPRVTFLGKAGSIGDESSDTYLARRAARWSFPWQVVSDRDCHGALAYLRRPHCVAVLPSRLDNLPFTVLECLAAGVPFVTTSTGGIPEMIHPRDRARVLVEPTPASLAGRLEHVLRRGLVAAAPRMSAARTLDGWMTWHARTPAMAAPRRAIARAAAPLVSVCLTHHNRPAFLAAALETIAHQDYAHFEVILVDDGSDRPDAVRYLAALDAEFARRGWTLIRQPNRYLGAARNAAIRAARGEYLLFMDDDNLATPHEISTFVRAATRSRADILTCFLDVVQSAEPLAPAAAPDIWPFLGSALGPGVMRNVFGDANAFIRRDLFARIGGFTEDVGVGCEDWELFARAVLSGARLEVVPEPLVRYRQSSQGMLHSTSQAANRRRAMRPYLSMLPPPVRAMVHLAHARPPVDNAAAPALDHVQSAVVFGTGEAGRRALTLASRCGWTVPFLVDNNPSSWETTAHGLPVRSPATLAATRADLVIVASLAGKRAITAQLESMGYAPGSNLVHFLDPVRVGGATVQLSLS